MLCVGIENSIISNDYIPKTKTKPMSNNIYIYICTIIYNIVYFDI